MNSRSSNKVYNWGILACGLIANDFALCLDKFPRANIRACAARSKDSAVKFAKKFDIPISRAYGSYEELFNDKNIDIIYIAAINPLHLKYTKAALNAGKHVLCEVW